MSEEQKFDETKFRQEVEESLAEPEEVVEEVVEEHDGESSLEYSEIEQEAMKRGWRPEGVEGKRKLTAEEFLDRQPLYDEINHLKKDVKSVQKAFEALKKHHERVKEAERKKVIEELKLQKRLALEADDFDKVIEIDDRIMEANTQKEEDELPDIAAPTTNEVFENWVSDNRWYHTDKELRTRADIIGEIYFRNNPESTLEDVYSYVEKSIKKEFPDKFGSTTRKPAVASVDSGSRRTAKSTTTTKKYSAKDLPEDAFQIMKTLVRAGAVTEEKYLAEYFESA